MLFLCFFVVLFLCFSYAFLELFSMPFLCFSFAFPFLSFNWVDYLLNKKNNTKRFRNQSKIGSKIDRKSIKSRSKIDQKSIFKVIFYKVRFKDRFLTAFGLIFEAKLASCWWNFRMFLRSQEALWKNFVSNMILKLFSSDLGASWESQIECFVAEGLQFSTFCHL